MKKYPGSECIRSEKCKNPDKYLQNAYMTKRSTNFRNYIRIRKRSVTAGLFLLPEKG